MVVNTVSGEKLHDFEIICPARGLQSPPITPSHTGLELCLGSKYGALLPEIHVFVTSLLKAMVT